MSQERLQSHGVQSGVSCTAPRSELQTGNWGNMSLPLGRLCRPTHSASKPGGSSLGWQEEGGKTPPLGMPLTEVDQKDL